MLNNCYYELAIYCLNGGKKKLIYYNACISSLCKVYRAILEKCFMPDKIYKELHNLFDYKEFTLSYIDHDCDWFSVRVIRKEYK